MQAKTSTTLQVSKLLLDARNVELLRLLSGDPRMSTSELARRIGMSAPAVRERVQRLEEAGVIKGYRLEIDGRALGYQVAAFVRVRPMPGTLPRIMSLAQRLPEVTECYRITGEDCFILKVHLHTLDNLDRILDQFLAFGQTTTSLVQSVPVPPRGLPLPSRRRQ
jgi:Lrp/AsnC family transcriptional regulator, leucine-responsive regulatory protein